MHYFQSLIKTFVIFIVFSQLPLACSDGAQTKTSRRTKAITAGDLSIAGSIVSVHINPIDQSDLPGTGKVESFEMDVSCGDKLIHQSIGASFKLSNGSKDCVAKLKSFVLNGTTYSIDANQSYDRFSEGEIARFHSLVTDSAFYMKIVKQLPTEITKEESVFYYFSESEDFGTIVPEEVDKVDVKLKVLGQFAPAFSVSRAQVDDQNEFFEFTFECDQPVQGSSLEDGSCVDGYLSNLVMTIAEHPNNVDKNYLDKISTTGERLIDLKSIFIAPETRLKNGGFIIYLHYDPANTNDRILVLNDLNHDSYLYGKIKVKKTR